ncbi:hypothetical protein D3C75_1004660 [compost metagenome]
MVIRIIAFTESLIHILIELSVAVKDRFEVFYAIYLQRIRIRLRHIHLRCSQGLLAKKSVCRVPALAVGIEQADFAILRQGCGTGPFFGLIVQNRIVRNIFIAVLKDSAGVFPAVNGGVAHFLIEHVDECVPSFFGISRQRKNDMVAIIFGNGSVRILQRPAVPDIKVDGVAPLI